MIIRAAKNINDYCTIHSCQSCRFWMDGWECMFRTSPARWGDMLEVLERQDNE
nr:MAG TPA: His-Me finger endonuclease beta4-alpha2 domain [Caudoviricetes sp.]